MSSAKIGGDWASWEAVPLPCDKLNFWDEPYAELYDWYPWLRRFYFKWEIEHNCLHVMANRKPFDLRRSLVAWNFLLSAFSFIGAARTVPHLLNILYIYGFKYTICAKPSVWYGSGAIGMWTQAFIFSKIPELGDTVFVVLRKKPLIFLHWYHHVTVLLYCWHSYYEQTTYGLYFICMNYTVHALMYLYYGLAGMRIRLCKPYYITTMQISQMVVGIAVCVAGGYYIAMGETQFISRPNFQAGVVMYFSYMLLFMQYALGRFLPNGGRGKKLTNGRGASTTTSTTAAGAAGASAPSNGSNEGIRNTSTTRKTRFKAE
eukprot:jgi/Undpi1/1400/HiC_scaffold_11.g04792.m1